MARKWESVGNSKSRVPGRAPGVRIPPSPPTLRLNLALRHFASSNLFQEATFSRSAAKVLSLISNGLFDIGISVASELNRFAHCETLIWTIMDRVRRENTTCA